MGMGKMDWSEFVIIVLSLIDIKVIGSSVWVPFICD